MYERGFQKTCYQNEVWTLQYFLKTRKKICEIKYNYEVLKVLTVSMGYEAYATGAPSWVETSQPLTCWRGGGGIKSSITSRWKMGAKENSEENLVSASR